MLLERARRILASGEGKFSPSPSPVPCSTRSQTSCSSLLRTPSKLLRHRRRRSRRAKRSIACSHGSWPTRAVQIHRSKRLLRRPWASASSPRPASYRSSRCHSRRCAACRESARAAARSAAASDTALQARPWRQLSQALMQTSSRLLSGGRAAKCTSASTSWTRCCQGPTATSRSHPGGRAGQVCYLRRGATGPAGVRNWPTVAGPMPRAVLFSGTHGQTQIAPREGCYARPFLW